MDEWRWQEIQGPLELAKEWAAQLDQLGVAMGVLLTGEETSAAEEARAAAAKASDLAHQLARWSADEPFESLALAATQLCDSLELTKVQLDATEAQDGTKAYLHDSLNYLHGSAVDLAAQAAELAATQAS